MKPYLYRNQILNKPTAQTAIVTGAAYKLEIPQGGRVSPHELELHACVELELLDLNDAKAPCGVRLRLETSLDGVDWVHVAVLHSLDEVGSYKGIRVTDEEVLAFVRVVAVPFSDDENLPTWRGNVSLIGDGPFAAKLA